MTKRLFPKFSLARDPDSRLGKIVHALKRFVTNFCFMFTVMAILMDIKARIGLSDDPSPILLSGNTSFYRDSATLALILLVFEKMKEYGKRLSTLSP